jgi:2-polyprenyl-3-methyl-5-hydroxy-6-metoxy-1,4-benzoquinol methylase
VKGSVQKRFWDREQVARLESGDDNNRRRVARLLETIKRAARGVQPSATSVLNIGIGNGLLEFRLAESGFQVFSLDPSEGAGLRLDPAPKYPFKPSPSILW